MRLQLLIGVVTRSGGATTELSETFISAAPQPKVSHVSKINQGTGCIKKTSSIFIAMLSGSEAYAKL